MEHLEADPRSHPLALHLRDSVSRLTFQAREGRLRPFEYRKVNYLQGNINTISPTYEQPINSPTDNRRPHHSLYSYHTST